MGARFAVLLVVVGGCSSGGSAQPDLSANDLGIPPQFGLTGTFAGALEVNLAGDGGAATLELLTLIDAFDTPSSDGNTATVSALWHPCGVTLPGGLKVPYAYALEPLSITQQNAGMLDQRGDARFMGQPVTWAVGYCPYLASDPLPTAGATLCPAATPDQPNPCLLAPQKPCVLRSTDAGGAVHPGVPVVASGLQPDADVLYVDAKITFAVDANLRAASQLEGAASSGELVWNVVGCHLRAGRDCTAAEAAALDAQKRTGAFESGTFRAHVQPQYYTCPLFLADPGDSVVTFDPLDGGIPDGGLTRMSFQLVQDDLDAMGCPTCHDQFHAPGQLHLVYKPWSPEVLKLNYQNLLPWTAPSTAGGRVGGRFVNDPAPVPEWMTQRWLSWVAAGMPY